MNRVAHIACFIACALWASVYVVIRYELHFFHPTSLALFRYAIASLCMLVLYGYRRDQLTLKNWHFIQVLLLGFIGIGVYNIFLMTAEKILTAGTMSFLNQQSPILTALFACVFLRERLSSLGWLGFLVSVVGIVILILAQHGGITWHDGIYLGLIAVILGTSFSVGQKYLLKAVHPIEFTTVAIWGSFLGLLIFTPNLIHDVHHLSTPSIMWVIYLGLFPAAGAYTLWSYGLAKIPLSQATAYLYCQPIITLLLAWLTLGEIVQPLAILGGLIAIAGCLLVNHSKVRT
ncbi:MAG: EamA family transporter [Legionellales bacterium]|nr:EamA family transporter [Legionellales bacterium]